MLDENIFLVLDGHFRFIFNYVHPSLGNFLGINFKKRTNPASFCLSWSSFQPQLYRKL